MKKFLSFLVVVSFVVFIPNVAKAGNMIGTWAINYAYDLYDNSGGLMQTGYLSTELTIFEQDGEVRSPYMWVEYDPATSRYTATHSTTLNYDMVSYAYNEINDIWMELEYTDDSWVVIGDMMVGELNGVYTGNVGLAGWRHDPSEPLQWDDMTGYMDFIPYAYDTNIDGMSVHLLGYGSRVPIPSASFLLGSGLIGLVGLRRKFRK